jgi:hypothetical protein
MPAKIGRMAKGYTYQYTIGHNAYTNGKEAMAELAVAYQDNLTCKVLIKAVSEKTRRKYITLSGSDVFAAAEAAWKENVDIIPGEFVDMDEKPVSSLATILANISSDFLIDVFNEIMEPVCHSDPNG